MTAETKCRLEKAVECIRSVYQYVDGQITGPEKTITKDVYNTLLDMGLTSTQARKQISRKMFDTLSWNNSRETYSWDAGIYEENVSQIHLACMN